LHSMKSLKVLPVLFLLFVLASCRKDPKVLTDSSARLGFSEDTVMFDTIFTSVGSVTKRFKIYNSNNGPVIVSSIRLGRGPSSLFRLNVDGISGKEIRNIEIAGKDSAFVFVEVTINPNSAATPLVVSDSILFFTNGNVQQVQLVAWGQDAYFHVARNGGIRVFAVDTVNQNVVWDNKKPHVVYGYPLVDSLQQLTIQAGTKVHFHRNSGLIVYNQGSLKVEGTQQQPVVFQGDRLDEEYKDLSSQWDRIWLSAGSRDNRFEYAIIKNGNVGIQVDTVGNANPTVVISNTIIENMAGAALYAQGAKVRATNSVFANCGQFLAFLNIGGDYEFTHCTFANYWRGNRQTVSIVLNNYYEDINGVIQKRNLDKADFRNCIIHGNLENEILFDSQPGAVFNYRLDHCLIKIDPAVSTTNPSNYRNLIVNPDIVSDSTIFRDRFAGNYELSTTSVAKDKGDPAFTAQVPVDIKGVSRTSSPDLGAYER
jgi:hypothetical protein